MTEQNPDQGGKGPAPKVVIVGPDGMARAGGTGSGTSSESNRDGEGQDGESDSSPDSEPHFTDLVEQPAKVMRIGSMIRQLLDEVKSAPVDEASRVRLKQIHKSSIKELEAGLAPELIEELERLALPFTDATPSESELRIAQAQLVGWLEGLFHGIQTAIYAQQMAARAQLEQMRRALPPGMVPDEAVQAAHQAQQAQQQGRPGQGDESPGRGGGMYL
ncbi:MAG TPA: bacterial proteasome activator family protein [Nocardioidaceae bacterium]|nr:bacterial proteasome activator family protein [Nocardioidaceae bacterium]